MSKKPQAVIIACGALVYNALLAAKELEKEKIGTVVLNSPSVKAAKNGIKTILELVEKYPAVVTVEEHQIHGGLGSAVAELLAKHRPVPMEFIGLKDTFGESGSPEELIEKYGMGVKDIKKRWESVLKRTYEV